MELQPEQEQDSRRAVTTLIVVMGMVLLWSFMFAPRVTSPPPAETEEETVEKPSTSEPAAKEPTKKPGPPVVKQPRPPKPTTATPVVTPPKPEPELPHREITKHSKRLSATFTNRDGALARLVLLDHYRTPLTKRDAYRARQAGTERDLSAYGLPLLGQTGTDPSLVLLDRSELSGNKQAASDSPGGAAAAPPLKLSSLRFKLVEAESNEPHKVTFRALSPDGRLEVTRIFELPRPDDPLQRHITLTLQFRNLSNEALPLTGYLLRGPGGIAVDLAASSWKKGRTVPNEREREAGAALLYASVATESEGGEVNVAHESCRSLAKREEPFDRSEGRVLWAAIQSNYFTAILRPLPQKSERGRQDRVWSAGGQSVAEHNVSAYIQARFDPTKLKPGESVAHTYQLYAGPKTKRDLGAYQANYEHIIDRHWYDPLMHVMTWILRSAHAVTFNWGIAIIILTIIVRLALHPLSKKSQTSMAKMQKLQPQVLAVREKYKNDKRRQQQEMMKLYKDYGVNPLGGCLPLIFQIPVFIGLWQTLRASIELRHAPFVFWIQDLSQPDALLGVVNILPILSVLIMFIQQSMQPKPADPKQEQMQKMMRYMMPVVLGFIFYGMPSGLNLYFTVSMLIGVLEQKRIRHHLDKMGDLKPVRAKPDKQKKKAVIARTKKPTKRRAF